MDDETTEGLINRVGKWLQEQGYPLEMRTARQFQSKGLWATLGHYYRDIETGHQRETDVFVNAHREIEGAGTASVCLTIECKSSRTKPWVIFTGEPEPHPMVRGLRRSQRLVAPESSWLWDILDKLDDAHPVPLLDAYEPLGHSIARAHGGSNEDVAFGAIMAASKAAAGMRQENAEFGFDFPTVVLPVVLIDAPLLKCSLDGDGEPQLSVIDRGTVMWSFQLAPDLPPFTAVTVVTSAGVPDLVDDLITTAESLASVRSSE